MQPLTHGISLGNYYNYTGRDRASRSLAGQLAISRVQ